MFSSSRGLNEWDVAAGQVILEELGFKVGDLNGGEFVYNKERPNMGREGIMIAHPAIVDLLEETRLKSAFGERQIPPTFLGRDHPRTKP